MYQEVKAAIKYGRDVIALEDVLIALKLKDFELQLKTESKKEELYLVGGRSPKKVPEGFEQDGLEGYQLARDRTKREIHPSERFAEVDLIEFALAVVQQTELEEPKGYKEAISSGNKS
uniref:Uncharacterized protein n=1 Tax=Cannabis sativa TaxID=3483 RepID=A0A803PTN4_CANSA